ncbi:jerky protein homolog-like [Phlebotomus papatasi]|uniref:jerky protein homolog-like n=1 Tax=Phlebotomus papatasi TaxID=29031 RepID=UPI002484187D|nr:jerky protein homolog-like [Phlebotomus papatasi]
MKRARTSTTIAKKVEAVELLQSGEPLNSVTAIYHVDRSTVHKWKNNYQTLRMNLKNNSGKKKLRHSDYSKTCEALSLWFYCMREKGELPFCASGTIVLSIFSHVGMPISGPLLRGKALEFHKQFQDGPINFTASTGWLDKWKKRHGMRRLTVSGESLSSNEEMLPEFLESLQNIIEEDDLILDQIYNADETGLNYRRLPNKTLVEKNRRSAPGFKVNKERVSVLACANATGLHKLPLFVIGKAQNPRAFKNVDKSSFPVKYGHQASSWMSKVLFRDWFFSDFVPQVRDYLRRQGLPEKALLILDNAPVHPHASELVSGGIKVLYLPPNCTATIQPMDQNILETMKRKYKSMFVQFLLQNLDNEQDLMESIKKTNILQAILWLSEAWDNVQSGTIARSWKGIFTETYTPDDQEEIQQIENDQTDEISELYELMNLLPVTEPLTQDDVQQWCTDKSMEISNGEIIQMVEDMYADNEILNLQEEAIRDENLRLGMKKKDCMFLKMLSNLHTSKENANPGFPCS